MIQPEQQDFHLADDVFIRHIHIEAAGSIVPQHAHKYDHTSFLARGALFAWRDGVPLGRHQAPCGIFIPAGAKHTFQTVEDNTIILCIHSLHNEGFVEILEEHQITRDELRELAGT